MRVGIVGCGNISHNHIAAFDDIEETEVVGVCDIDLSRARRTAEAWDIGVAVDSVSELLGLGLDIVSVCTPHPTHEAVVLEAAAAGVHVLCEKPIAVDVASAERMAAACGYHGVKLGVLFQRRFWPADAAACLHRRRHAGHSDSGSGLGAAAPRTGVLLGGRVARDLGQRRRRGAHDPGDPLYDLLQWYMGEVSEVYGAINTFKHGADIEVEDTASAVLKFTSGALATLNASTATNPALGVQIRITGSTGATAELSEFPEGSDGRITLRAAGHTVSSSLAHPAGVTANAELSTINAALIPHHREQIREFVHAVIHGHDPAVTGHDAAKSLRILLAIYTSARTGEPVRFAPFPAHVPTAKI